MLFFGDAESDTAIHRATFFGFVVTNGMLVAIALCFHTGRINAELDEFRHDIISAVAGKLQIGSSVTGVIGVAADFDLHFRERLHDGRHICQLLMRSGLEGSGTSSEEETVKIEPSGFVDRVRGLNPFDEPAFDAEFGNAEFRAIGQLQFEHIAQFCSSGWDRRARRR